MLGPGLVTGASDDDPSGIATYSISGARFGYAQLWLALFMFPMMTVVQEMSARIGLVTGKGLAGVIRQHYSRPILYGTVFLLVGANTVNIGADIGAMAASVQMVTGLPFVAGALGLTLFTVAMEILVTYKLYAKYLKWLSVSLFAYIFAAFTVQQDWGAILRSALLPSVRWDGPYLATMVAVLGTTISPYLFFWQASEEVEEEIKAGILPREGGKPRVGKRALFDMRADTAIGMLFSQVITFFIIVTTAATLHQNRVSDIQTAQQAAEALRPLAGDGATLLFSAGIIGTGLLAVPVLAGSTAYALAETFGWRWGLYRRWREAPAFYGVIAVSTLIGLALNFSGINPITALFYTAVINGLVAPVLLVMIILITGNRRIMGRHTNPAVVKVFGWMIVALMAAAAVAMYLTLARG